MNKKELEVEIEEFIKLKNYISKIESKANDLQIKLISKHNDDFVLIEYKIQEFLTISYKKILIRESEFKNIISIENYEPIDVPNLYLI